MSRIAILGGHGKVALLLARDLTDAGHRVTSLFRNPDHTDEVAATGADPVVFDLEAAGTDEIAARLAGHDAVVFSAGAGGGSPERTYAVDRDAAIRSIDAAASAGVRRYVMVSYLGAGPDHGIDPSDGFHAYAESKAAADAYLRRSSLDWTIVAPGSLTLDEPTGSIEVDPSAAQGERAGSSRANVALVIAAALATPASVGRTIGFTDGPTPIESAVATPAP
ncbi:NAD-dependent dehydratase [Tersicoccus solisilvae]|uniref:NAD-dependent dehydratase n=1 Tax=Tersicoccus solisilvae TaxID=1882339 RepID=A0ABQ1NN05_9MICC|nr:SDR family oxidoreductase [Tersicoccus solisilvae]GGC78802.1 NAD-dependent dehydratase [Tersicoccus solisilvae]